MTFLAAVVRPNKAELLCLTCALQQLQPACDQPKANPTPDSSTAPDGGSPSVVDGAPVATLLLRRDVGQLESLARAFELELRNARAGMLCGVGGCYPVLCEGTTTTPVVFDDTKPYHRVDTQQPVGTHHHTTHTNHHTDGQGLPGTETLTEKDIRPYATLPLDGFAWKDLPLPDERTESADTTAALAEHDVGTQADLSFLQDAGYLEGLIIKVCFGGGGRGVFVCFGGGDVCWGDVCVLGCYVWGNVVETCRRNVCML